MRKRSGNSLEADAGSRETAADADDEPGGSGGSAPDWRLRFMALSVVVWFALFGGARSPLDDPERRASGDRLPPVPDFDGEADLALEMFGYGGAGFESVDAALRAAGCKAHADCPVLPSTGGGGGGFFCTHQGDLADAVVMAGLKRAADQLAHVTEHGQLHDEGFDEVHLLHRASELFANGEIQRKPSLLDEESGSADSSGGGKGKHCLACKYCADGITFDGKCPAYCDQLAGSGEL